MTNDAGGRHAIGAGTAARRRPSGMSPTATLVSGTFDSSGLRRPWSTWGWFGWIRLVLPAAVAYVALGLTAGSTQGAVSTICNAVSLTFAVLGVVGVVVWVIARAITQGGKEQIAADQASWRYQPSRGPLGGLKATARRGVAGLGSVPLLGIGVGGPVAGLVLSNVSATHSQQDLSDLASFGAVVAVVGGALLLLSTARVSAAGDAVHVVDFFTETVIPVWDIEYIRWDNGLTVGSWSGANPGTRSSPWEWCSGVLLRGVGQAVRAGS